MGDKENGCGCRLVVTRVYGDLKARRMHEITAFDTAATIFRLHHPDVSEREARFTVAKWLA